MTANTIGTLVYEESTGRGSFTGRVVDWRIPLGEARKRVRAWLSIAWHVREMNGGRGFGGNGEYRFIARETGETVNLTRELDSLFGAEAPHAR